MQTKKELLRSSSALLTLPPPPRRPRIPKTGTNTSSRAPARPRAPSPRNPKPDARAPHLHPPGHEKVPLLRAAQTLVRSSLSQPKQHREACSSSHLESSRASAFHRSSSLRCGLLPKHGTARRAGLSLSKGRAASAQPRDARAETHRRHRFARAAAAIRRGARPARARLSPSPPLPKHRPAQTQAALHLSSQCAHNCSRW